MSRRLDRNALTGLPPGVIGPAYTPADHGAGIVHIGVGAFHRAHQAVYTDAALASEGGDWRIDGISLRSTAIADALNPQDGLFTVIERGGDGDLARVIGSIRHVVAASQDIGAALALLAAPRTRIVSITVTEKAYGIDRAQAQVEPGHPAIANDLASPLKPTGVIGMIVEGLRQRRERGIAPFSVLCCDNLPENGGLVRAGVLDFARRVDASLAEWIGEKVAFPSTMVDRITPAPTAETLADTERFIGVVDKAAVETEPFSQWVIEDRFAGGRPAWEAGGAIFVRDVAPYETMKLRMLNGTHSMLAYAGFLSGHRYVREVMRDAALTRLVRRHLGAAAATLEPLAGIDLAEYAEALMNRFSNPAIAHETYQIAMDGTEKLPQRILTPALHALRNGQDIRPFAFTIAAWMRYCIGKADDGTSFSLRDPREDAIHAAVQVQREPSGIVHALSALPGLFPAELAGNEHWNGLVSEILTTMLERNMVAAIAAEAEYL